jgi:hypothetical protein
MAVQILLRRGTAAEWTSVNPVLGSGEPGFETDTGRFKIGNGTGTWNELPYSANEGGEGGSGTVTAVSVATANGFAGTVANATTTPAISVRTTVNGLLKGNGTAISAAAAGTDYQAPITLTTTGSSGAATLIGNTLNIPQYSSGGGEGATYSISAETTTGGANLRLTGSDASTDDVTFAAGANVTIARTDANTITISASGGGEGGTLASRSSLSGSTGSLASGATGPINIEGFSTYALMKVETSHAAWVRIYVSEAARQADATRTQGEDPLPGSGVIAEVITTGAETVLISPGTIGFNNESPVTNNIPVRVTNLSGGTATVTVTLTAIQLEA